MPELKAPFPWHGGKRRVAHIVWRAFGADVPNYIEPAFGSGAVLLGRPGGAGKIETINDLNCDVANFWRAVKQDPATVAKHCDWPVNECAPAGTAIATPTGPKPIESIRAGDTVWGFDGARVVATRVLATRKSTSAEPLFRVGDVLLTGNHPVWTAERGYVEARHLVEGMTVRILEKSRADLANIRAGGSPDAASEVHRGDLPPQVSAERTPLASPGGRPYTPRLLDPIPLVAGPAANPSGARDWRLRRVAGRGAEMDRRLSSDVSARESHRGGRRDAGLRADTRIARQVVAHPQRAQVPTGAGSWHARQDARARGAGENRSGVARTKADGGGASESLGGTSRQAPFGAAHREIVGGEARGDTDARAQGEDRRGDTEPQSSSLYRDWGRVPVNNSSGEDAWCNGSVCQSGDPQGLPLSREPLAFRVARAVYNFQTATGSYFAGGVLVHNCDLHARHLRLVETLPEHREKTLANPDYFDVKRAGWWVWGLGIWIGGGWCSERSLHRKRLTRKTPNLTANYGKGAGVHTPDGRRPHLGRFNGVHTKQQLPSLHGERGITAGRLPNLGNTRRGVHRDNCPPCKQWFHALQERLRRVRVCCGDWSRVLTPSVTGATTVRNSGMNPCAVFLDLPYSDELRQPGIYAEDDAGAAAKAAEWAREHGDDPDLRIALCGYEGEHEMPADWTEYAWKGPKGYGSGKNRDKERIYLSPHCLPLEEAQGRLFEEAASV